MVLLQQEHFLCESKDVDVLMYQINGKVFFNATKVWRNFGSPSSLEFSDYLRTESARKLMIQMYGNLKGFDKLLLEINALLKGGKIPPFSKAKTNAHNFFDSTKTIDDLEVSNEIAIFLQATLQIRLNKLNPEFEKDFVHVIKGRSGGTFLCYDLFLDYCTHLSTQLKLQVFETFKKFGDLNNLKGQPLIDSLQRKIDEEKAKLPAFTSQVAPIFVREEVKGRTKSLQRSIQNMYYLSDKKPNRNMYSYIHNQVNINLFGMSSNNMQKLIALSESSKTLIRDCMTEKAIRLLEQVEAALYVFLTDCYEADIYVTLEKLNEMLSNTCSSVKSLAFLVKKDFHLLQNAIERDYDLLVKNADCVKDLGVVPRPDEICEKTKLVPITNATKQLVSEMPKRDNKGMSEQLTLF